MGAPSLLPTTIKLTCVLSQQRVSDKTCNMSMNTALHYNALKREQLPTSAFTDVAFAPEMGTLKFGVRSA